MTVPHTDRRATWRATRRGAKAPAYLAVQPLDLLFAPVGLVGTRGVDGGEQQLGVGQQSPSSPQVCPQLLLHIKVSVSHLQDHSMLVFFYRFLVTRSCGYQEKTSLLIKDPRGQSPSILQLSCILLYPCKRPDPPQLITTELQSPAQLQPHQTKRTDLNVVNDGQR